MPALFPPWTNTLYRVVLGAAALGLAGAIAAPMIVMRTSYATHEGEVIDQPVQFDHRHHTRDDGIDCVYCHRTVETEASAGYPATEVCMGCHAQVWNQSPILAPVRASWESGTPIPWKRVYVLPDYVRFDHGVHVSGAGLACSACHGDVTTQARIGKAAPLTMGWCLDCHRQSVGRKVAPITTCSACHR